jgi:hypothetical protein
MPTKRLVPLLLSAMVPVCFLLTVLLILAWNYK